MKTPPKIIGGVFGDTLETIQSVLTNFQSIYFNIWAVRTNNLFLALLVKINVLAAYVVSENYVVVILLIIPIYTALFPLNRGVNCLLVLILKGL